MFLRDLRHLFDSVSRRRTAQRDRDEAAILGWLARFGPANARDVSIGARLGSNRTYGCLDRMESDGRVVGRWALQAGSEGIPRRRLYDISRTRWVNHGPVA